VSETIGERLRNLRDKKGYTLEKAGSLVGITKQTLYKYENGIITNIPSDKIEQLAKIYNVSPTYIMGWEDMPTNFEDPAEAIKFILEQPALMAYGGYNLETMSDEQILEIANDLLYALRLSAERHKRKK